MPWYEGTLAALPPRARARGLRPQPPGLRASRSSGWSGRCPTSTTTTAATPARSPRASSARATRWSCLPSGRETRIAAIDSYDGEMEEAYPPLSVTMRLEDDVDVSRGDMICREHNRPVEAREIDAMVCWMSERPLSSARPLPHQAHDPDRARQDRRGPLPDRRQHAAPRRGGRRPAAQRDRPPQAAALVAAVRRPVPAQPGDRQLHPHRRVDQRHRRCRDGPVGASQSYPVALVDFALIAFGLGVGILVGMTGIGGGSLMTPMLILVFGVTPITAIGTDLAYAAVTKTVGGYKHWTQKTVDLQLSTWMALGSVPAASAASTSSSCSRIGRGTGLRRPAADAARRRAASNGGHARAAFLKSMHARERETIESSTPATRSPRSPSA